MTIRLVKFNEVPRMWCYSCGDSGVIEHFRADESFLRWEPCGCKQPAIYKWPVVWKKADHEITDEERRLRLCPF